MTHRHLLIAIISTLGCTPEPYLRTKGPVILTVKVSQPVFDPSGLRLHLLGTACSAKVTEHWCPETAPECRPQPVVARDESVDCPQNVTPAAFSLNTPWKQAYPATVSKGVLGVKIDWDSVPLGDLGEEALRGGWVLHSNDGADIDTPLDFTAQDVQALLDAVREATGNDYSEARIDEHATLSVTASSDERGGAEHHVIVSVTNQGPGPAYRVVAQLRSRSKEAQGIKLSFGRIDPAETKKRARDIATPADGDAAIYVEVTSSNAALATASHEVWLRAKHADPTPPTTPPRLACSLPIKQATAGQTLRVPCEASNQGERPVKGMVYKVAVGSAPPLLAPGPTDLLPHAPPSKFEVDVTLPPDAKPGSLMVIVTARGPDVPSVRQEVSAEVIEPVEPTKLCAQGELTTKDYRKKRSLLEEQRMAGSITQEEFNDILAEWWNCVRQH